jgi:DNA-binding CsgD family transcriptional regulator
LVIYVRALRERGLEPVASPLQPAHAALSAREMEILRLIGLSLSSKEISSSLGLTVYTVGSYRKRICKKLDIHSTAGLALYAAMNGIVDASARLSGLV